jgi:S-adenosylmethionine:tRNA ribosyltransferase-isomerase
MGLRVEDFDYPLHKELIAQYPEQDRSASRLLVADRKTGGMEHRFFRDLPSYLVAGDVLVLNETKVLPARITAKKRTGGKLDILLTERIDERHWFCLVQNPGKQGTFDAVLDHRSVSLRRDGGAWIAEFPDGSDEIIREFGTMPLPHYIKRGSNGVDAQKYQTVYAREPGSIAAPTAGLHFTEELLQAISKRGVHIAKLTLHIGVGTFRLIKKEMVEEHRMDAEQYVIPDDVRTFLGNARAEGRRLIAVGTSVVRTLESAFASGGQGRGATSLFIYPGYRFRMVDALITNFHLPRSTPLLLAAAFGGKETLFSCYREAIERKYRFYSYGDAMFLV